MAARRSAVCGRMTSSSSGALDAGPDVDDGTVRKVVDMRDDDPKIDQTLAWLETVLRTANEVQP